jgi:1-acyl-sn-glycerol-3-phosphate acyltransferase
MFSLARLLAVWVPLGSLVGIVGIPWTLLTGKIDWMYHSALWVVRSGLGAAGVTVRVEGMEHVPAGRSCIFMCNHVSNLDPPVLVPILPRRVSVMLKKSLMQIPILGYAMKLGKFVPVERAARRDAAQASVATAVEALASGLDMLVFPEGTRSPDGRLASFKKGPFFLAQQSGAPVVPIVISGTQRMMRKGELKLYPGVARVRMLTAIDPGAYPTREDLLEAVRDAMIAALPPEMKPAAGGVLAATSESR